MPQMTSLHEVHAELAEEHRRIMALVEHIEAETRAASLPPLLDELHDLLVDHFAHEQFPGGLYESMGAYGPEHADDLKALVREHCIILSNARGLLVRSHVVQGPDEAQLLEDVRAMIEQLRDHEHREHRLVEKLKAGALGKTEKNPT